MTIERARLAWVDFAKGVAIVAVVFHHAVQFLDRVSPMPGLVLHADQQIATFRMPLFFLASGFFAAKTLRSGWSAVLHKRVALFMYIYALWNTIQFVVSSLMPPELEPRATFGDYLLSFIAPDSVLWFVYALAVYSVVARACLSVPPIAQVAAALVVAFLVSSDIVHVEQYAWRLSLMSYVFFIFAVHYRDLVDGLARRATWPVALATCATYTLCVFVVGQVFPDRMPPGLRLSLSVLSLAAGVTASVVVVAVPGMRVVAWLGTRTLPVYVAHMLVIQALGLVLWKAGWTAQPVAEAAAVSVALTLTAIVVTLALHGGLRALGASWFYELPRRWAWRPPLVATEPAKSEREAAAPVPARPQNRVAG
ncbi:acyltransferase family protein [Cellulomonas sp. JH27-2]|uniref:acyltransferase family protein n=1 Tax=Cellulomonas sp. JH27-2 TaxID=2774139 RepID=UPI0017805835|nr:acyltransferase family protein [Cellulomonas sp. JH27-2]